MRKWNTILSVLMLLIFMIHGIMGSFMLNGVGSSAGKLLAWIGVGILVVHTVIGVILTVQSLQTAKQSGKMYLKQNVIFWARRASGMAILILLLFHIGLFGKVQNGTYILFPFTTVKMVTSNKIRIGLGTKDYDVYAVYSGKTELQSLFHSMLILPALVYVFEELRQEGGEETYHNKEWFLALEKSYAKRGITFMEEVLNPEKTSYQLAQEAMELPLSKAFDQIPIFFDTTEEDS